MRAAVSRVPHRAQLSLWGFGAYQHCPLTFLLNCFHQLHQERRGNLGRAELLLQVRQRRPWGRGRGEKGSAPAQPSAEELGQGTTQATPNRSKESCGPRCEAVAQANTAWSLRGTCPGASTALVELQP